MINLDKLEALAQAAVPWWNTDLETARWYPDTGEFCDGGSDATDFIQAANPQTALQLIADYKLLQSTNADAMRTITAQVTELARLRTELGAKTPPQAVAPYHRLDFGGKRPCNRCTQDMDDIYLTAFGQEDLCASCATELGAETFVPEED